MISSRAAGTGLLAAAGLGTLAVIAHAAPALTAHNRLRQRLWPTLAGVGDPQHVALTFDDGPDRRSTPQFLDLLQHHQVRATFFLLGRMVARNPCLGKEIVTAGHEIGLHGYHHDLLLNKTPAATRDDLLRGYEVITDVCGQPPAFYRPPYGVLTTAALFTARRLDLPPVLWTAWGRDWTRHATPRSVYRTVTKNLTGGATILLHDCDCTAFPGSWKATLGALPALIHTIRRQHLTPGPLGDHHLRSGTARHVAPAHDGVARGGVPQPRPPARSATPLP
jgi:peptidoglycan-N-acetylglucosamine deacetylase